MLAEQPQGQDPHNIASRIVRGAFARLQAGEHLGDHGASLLSEALAREISGNQALLSSLARSRRFRGGLSPACVRRCYAYAESITDRRISLAELAEVAGLSVYHFSRAFKRSTGVSPGVYLRTVRRRHAERLLKDTNLSITEVAMALGYDTSQAFARMFRQEAGMCPSDFRRNAAFATETGAAAAPAGAVR